MTLSLRESLSSLLVLGLSCLGGLLFLAYKPSASVPAPPSYPVEGEAVHVPLGSEAFKFLEFENVSFKPPLPSLPSPGKVQVDELKLTRLMAPLGGRVLSAPIRVGAMVKKGDLLLSIRSSEMDELNASIRKTEAEYAAARNSKARIAKLVAASAAPRKELTEAERDERIAALELKALKSKKAALNLNVEDEGIFQILAPQSGVVLSREVSEGELISSDSGIPLMTIADISEVRVIASLTEEEAAHVKIGDQGIINSDGLSELHGVVEQISSLVSPSQRTVDVELRVRQREDRPLRLNAFVEVTFTAKGEDRLLVPQSAIVTDHDHAVVFVKDEKSDKLQKRRVQLGRQRHDQAEILSGLQENELIVKEGALLLLNTIQLSSM